MACLIGPTEWPSVTFHRPATASMTRRPLSSVICTPSPLTITRAGSAITSAGCAIGCQKFSGLAEEGEFADMPRLLIQNFLDRSVRPLRIAHVELHGFEAYILRALHIAGLIVD